MIEQIHQLSNLSVSKAHTRLISAFKFSAFCVGEISKLVIIRDRHFNPLGSIRRFVGKLGMTLGIILKILFRGNERVVWFVNAVADEEWAIMLCFEHLQQLLIIDAIRLVDVIAFGCFPCGPRDLAVGQITPCTLAA